MFVPFPLPVAFPKKPWRSCACASALVYASKQPLVTYHWWPANDWDSSTEKRPSRCALLIGEGRAWANFTNHEVPLFAIATVYVPLGLKTSSLFLFWWGRCWTPSEDVDAGSLSILLYPSKLDIPSGNETRQIWVGFPINTSILIDDQSKMGLSLLKLGQLGGQLSVQRLGGSQSELWIFSIEFPKHKIVMVS